MKFIKNFTQKNPTLASNLLPFPSSRSHNSISIFRYKSTSSHNSLRHWKCIKHRKQTFNFSLSPSGHDTCKKRRTSKKFVAIHGVHSWSCYRDSVVKFCKKLLRVLTMNMTHNFDLESQWLFLQSCAMKVQLALIEVKDMKLCNDLECEKFCRTNDRPS